jgi:NAD(P)-dependent dehydrogenase (short-subunit alcohol dehydrogenase family)
MGNGSRPSAPLDTALGSWRRVQYANLTPIFLCCKHGVSAMLETTPAGGSVINAASFVAEIGAATAPMSYAASKAAVIQLSRDSGVHLARSGVRVNSVVSGPIETSAQRAVFDRNPGAAAIALDGGITQAFTVPE